MKQHELISEKIDLLDDLNNRFEMLENKKEIGSLENIHKEIKDKSKLLNDLYIKSLKEDILFENIYKEIESLEDMYRVMRGITSLGDMTEELKEHIIKERKEYLEEDSKSESKLTKEMTEILNNFLKTTDK